MNTITAIEILTRSVETRDQFMLGGPPGVGKTALWEQAKEAGKVRHMVIQPVTSIPEDWKGFPIYDREIKKAWFVPYDILDLMIHTQEALAILFDDMGHASKSVQAALMHIIYARNINGLKISDSVTMDAATNRAGDMAGVNPIIEPMKNRFQAIINIEPDFESWSRWAFKANIPAIIIAYLKMNQNALFVHKPTNNLEVSPCPRGWENVSKILRGGYPERALKEMICGAVGVTHGTSFMGFHDNYTNMPNIDNIIAYPESAPLPNQIDVLYMVSTALIKLANRKNFNNIARYLMRMPADFIQMAKKDIELHRVDLTSAEGFSKLVFAVEQSQN